MRNGISAGTRVERQRAIRELVAAGAIGSQAELADALSRRGFAVTQATVSRDVAELGLVKVPRGDRHVYVASEDLAIRPPRSDDRLRRILADIPVTIGRSGLVLLIVGSAGTAQTVAQAIDESSLTEQEGTLAGDNTVLVLFADEPRLDRWLGRFRVVQAQALQPQAAVPADADPSRASTLTRSSEALT